MYFIPRNNIVQHAELNRKTVIEQAPESEQADEYRQLAHAIEDNEMFCVPTPITNDELEQLLMKYNPID